jgi:putative transposase
MVSGVDTTRFAELACPSQKGAGFYDTPDVRANDAIVVAEMKANSDEFEAYGCRRIDAVIRHRGMVVNAQKSRRLMRENALNPTRRRRVIATTDSNHDYPIFPDLANNMTPDGPNQFWVALRRNRD